MSRNHSPTVTRSEFAALFDVTPQAVSQWLQQGMPGRRSGKRGQAVEIDLQAAVPWALQRLIAPLPERERLAKEQADAVALRNDEHRRQLILAEHVRHAVEHLQDGLGDCLELPADLPERIAATSDPARIRAMLMDWIRRARGQYADQVDLA